MTPNEKRVAFISGILTNVWNSLNHAIRLVDGESVKLFGLDYPEGLKMIYDAYFAAEKAKDFFQNEAHKMTDYGEDQKTEGEK